MDTRIRKNKVRNLFVYIKHHPMLYIMLLPGLFFLFVYKLLPLYGITIAFKDYNIFLGNTPIEAIGLSKWVGLKYFDKLFRSNVFWKVLYNTLIINGMKVVFLFPLPIICAILLILYKHFLSFCILFKDGILNIQGMILRPNGYNKEVAKLIEVFFIR